MSSTSIYKTPLRAFKAVAWKNQAVYKQYPKLKNYLKQQLGDEPALLFAEPHITEADWQGLSEASWTTESVTDNFVPVSQLPPERQAVVRQRLAQQLGIIQDFSQRQLESDDPGNNAWGQLINKALQIPDANHLLSNGERVVLVCWGLEYQQVDKSEFNLRKEYPRLPGAADNLAKLELPRQPDPEPEPELPDETAPAPEPEPEQPASPGTASPQPESVPPANPEPPNPPVTEPPKSTPPEPPKPPVAEPPTTHHWWRRHWWIWLLLLLCLLILLFFLWTCRRTHPLLPPQAGILVPIDSSKLIIPPDSTRVIVSDRLNVALTGANKDLHAFAEKFSELYPGNDYSIIYYDTVTSRLQLQVPASEKDKIAAGLQAKMPQFELLIWDEGLFKQNNRPSDPGFADTRESWYHTEIKAFDAWDVTRGDPNMIIAVIDDGFDLTHPELQGKIVSPWNVPKHSAQVDLGHNTFHGTHVAGLAVGTADNNMGVAGIAPNCKLMPVQVADYNGIMSSTAIIDGVLYAMGHGAKIINISLGKEAPASAKNLPPAVQRQLINSSFKGEEKFWNNLFHIAYDKNIVIVLAAGNEDLLIGLDPMERSRYAIKVSAVSPDERKADFSNYGELSTISAPGVGIYSSLPRTRFGFLDGTSMASPIVAGGIALIESANPSLTFDQVVDLIRSTGIPVNSPGRPIGNIIQLDKAVGFAGKGGQHLPKVGCPDAQRQIDSLLQEIEKIKRSCGNVATGDTLYIPPHAKNLKFAAGRWKSTSYIYNTTTGDPVTIYFDFQENGTGQLTLVQQDNTTCNANLALTLQSETLLIDQPRGAVCSPTYSYRPYSFVCHADSAGRAECKAQNKEDRSQHFSFNLVKVN